MYVFKSHLLFEYLREYSESEDITALRQSISNAVDANIEAGEDMHDIEIEVGIDILPCLVKSLVRGFLFLVQRQYLLFRDSPP